MQVLKQTICKHLQHDQTNLFLPTLFFFLGSQTFLLELSKKKKSAAGRHTTWKISAPTVKSLAKLQAIVNSPAREVPDNPHTGLGFQLHLQPGQEGMDIVSAPALSQAAPQKESGAVICGVLCGALLTMWRLKCGRHSLTTGGLSSKGRWISHGYSITLERLTHFS